jgi:hypothetical protein
MIARAHDRPRFQDLGRTAAEDSQTALSLAAEGEVTQVPVEAQSRRAARPAATCWSSVDLAPGATYGPKPHCFQASGDPNGKLTLLWSPDLLSPTVEIELQ